MKVLELGKTSLWLGPFKGFWALVYWLAAWKIRHSKGMPPRSNPTKFTKPSDGVLGSWKQFTESAGFNVGTWRRWIRTLRREVCNVNASGLGRSHQVGSQCRNFAMEDTLVFSWQLEDWAAAMCRTESEVRHVVGIGLLNQTGFYVAPANVFLRGEL